MSLPSSPLSLLPPLFPSFSFPTVLGNPALGIRRASQTLSPARSTLLAYGLIKSFTFLFIFIYFIFLNSVFL